MHQTRILGDILIVVGTLLDLFSCLNKITMLVVGLLFPKGIIIFRKDVWKPFEQMMVANSSCQHVEQHKQEVRNVTTSTVLKYMMALWDAY